ncbi:hypothetical protein ACKC9G_12495 [Pokkaliibacter sp. CJK22405]|uniref:hypothetical protein n=1 Tax=Pokkaliibacter sp. CJK22405 TaxID=3384615 RepID=UPI003984A885
MAVIIPPVVQSFLDSKGLDFSNDLAEGQDNRPFLLVVDDSFAVFLKVEDDERIIFFTFVADFEKVNFRSAFVLMHESLKLNNFKWEQKVNYSLDQEGQFLVAWNSMPLFGAEVGDLERGYQVIAQAYRSFSAMRDKVDSWSNQRMRRERAAAPRVQTGLRPRAGL